MPNQTASVVGSRRIRLVFVITSLGTGGAEAMLFRLVRALDKSLFEIYVIALDGVLTSGGNELESAGARLLWTARNRPFRRIRSTIALARLLEELRPDVVQGWMVHGNVAGQLAALRIEAPVIWGVRHSSLVAGKEKAATILLTRAMKFLSRWPARIIYNSAEGERHHREMGYCYSRAVVIPNGFEMGRFTIDDVARRTHRLALGVVGAEVVVGMVARYHPMKDHRTFLLAAKHVCHTQVPVTFLLVGKGCDDRNAELVDAVKRLGLADKVRLLGERSDVPALMNAFDVGVSSSSSEGFPNVVAEMMCCGVPCVVTRVGDSEFVVGDTGVAVTAGQPELLAKALVSMIEMQPASRRALGNAARARIERLFSIGPIAKKFESLYFECVSERT